MAQVTIGAGTITYNKDGVAKTFTIPRVAVDLAEGILAAGTKSIATSATQITGLPTTPGLVLIINRNATNYVRVGVDGTNWVVKLFPYDSAAPDMSYALFPLAGTTLYAIANTAACDVDYVVLSVAS